MHRSRGNCKSNNNKKQNTQKVSKEKETQERTKRSKVTLSTTATTTTTTTTSTWTPLPTPRGHKMCRKEVEMMGGEEGMEVGRGGGTFLRRQITSAPRSNNLAHLFLYILRNNKPTAHKTRSYKMKMI